MPTTLETAVDKYLRSGNPAQRTREEYSTTIRKWARWGGGVPLSQLGRKEIREFLDWVYDDAADVLGLLESHVLPVLTTVTAAIDARAVTYVSTGDVLAGANPYRIGVVRIQGDAAD